MKDDLRNRKHSLSLGLELFKDKKTIKFILEEFLDYAMGALLTNKDKFEEDEHLRKLYRKLSECIALVEEL